MKRIVTVVLAVMLAVLAIVPMTACAESANGTKMYVKTANGGTLRLRDLPCEAGKVLCNLGNGRPVEVVSQSDGWCEVKVQINGTTHWGYVMSKFVSAKDPSTARQSFKAVKNPFTVKVTPASARGVVSLWDTTSKKTEHKVCDLTKGEKLTVNAESNAWYQVTDSHGHTGYVAKAYVTK